MPVQAHYLHQLPQNAKLSGGAGVDLYHQDSAVILAATSVSTDRRSTLQHHIYGASNMWTKTCAQPNHFKVPVLYVWRARCYWWAWRGQMAGTDGIQGGGGLPEIGYPMGICPPPVLENPSWEWVQGTIQPSLRIAVRLARSLLLVGLAWPDGWHGWYSGGGGGLPEIGYPMGICPPPVLENPSWEWVQGTIQPSLRIAPCDLQPTLKKVLRCCQGTRMYFMPRGFATCVYILASRVGTPAVSQCLRAPGVKRRPRKDPVGGASEMSYAWDCGYKKTARRRLHRLYQLSVGWAGIGAWKRGWVGRLGKVLGNLDGRGSVCCLDQQGLVDPLPVRGGDGDIAPSFCTPDLYRLIRVGLWAFVIHRGLHIVKDPQ